MEYRMDTEQRPSRPWRDIAVQVSQEQDPSHLIELVDELLKCFDEDEARKKRKEFKVVDSR